LEIIGADLGENAPSDLKRSLRTHPKSYTVTVKNDDLGEKLGVVAFPTVLVVDQNGVVREVFTGYNQSFSGQLDAVVSGLLAAKS
jgi:hypothetical protein